jgi:hypothetical protein
LEIARNALEFYKTHGQEDRAKLLQFVLQGSKLEKERVIPVFKPPFDIIHALSVEARTLTAPPGIKKQAASCEATCPIELPAADRALTKKSH